MKFLIKRKYAPAEFNGSAQVYTTGQPGKINHSQSMIGVQVDENKIDYKTGFKDEDILSNPLFDDDEREIYLEKAKQLRDVIKKRHPYAEDSTNNTFWNQDRTTLKIDESRISLIHDTDTNIEDAILLLNILGGGYTTVSPTLENSDRTGNVFYLTSEDEFVEKVYGEEFGVKRKAIAALDELLEGKGKNNLIYLTYLTGGLNKGYTMTSSPAILEKAIMEFIEGKNDKYDKKSAAESFLKTYKEWKADKDTLIGKAIVEAAYYHGVLGYKDQKIVYLPLGLDLGRSTKDAYKYLIKPENNQVFDEIRNKVNDILSK